MNKKIKKDLKMLSVTYTYECIKKPRCSFCYLKKEKLARGLMEDSPLRYPWEWVFPVDKRDKLFLRAKQVAIAYNGLGITALISIIGKAQYSKCIINITTNPEFLNEPVIALFKRFKVKMIALSLDSEKCKTLKPWIKAAKDLRKKGIKVGANILMLDGMWKKVNRILNKVSPYCHQIHLLRPKFVEVKVPLKQRKEMTFLLKQKHKNLFIDECFRWEFTGRPCSRGKDFLSLNPDGSTSLCSFDIYRDNRKNLKKCPYI